MRMRTRGEDITEMQGAQQEQQPGAPLPTDINGMPLFGTEMSRPGAAAGRGACEPRGDDNGGEEPALPFLPPHQTATAAAPLSTSNELPPLRIGGGDGPPDPGGLRDEPDRSGNGGASASGGGTPRVGSRQVAATGSPSAAAGRDGCGGPLGSPRAMPSPVASPRRHQWDYEEHRAAIDMALPLSPGRSNAARAAVARSVGGLSAVLPCGAADTELAELDEEGLEEIMEACISRGACT